MFDMLGEVHEHIFVKDAPFTFPSEGDCTYYVVIKHSCTLLTEIMTDITVIIIKATFHLTYPMTEVGWGTADDLATRRLQG